MSPGNKINWFTQCVLVGAVEVLSGLFFFFFSFFTWALIDWAGQLEWDAGKGGNDMRYGSN